MWMKKRQEKKRQQEKSLQQDGAQEFKRRTEIEKRINFCKHIGGKINECQDFLITMVTCDET
jgi:hypothetical protein